MGFFRRMRYLDPTMSTPGPGWILPSKKAMRWGEARQRHRARGKPGTPSGSSPAPIVLAAFAIVCAGRVMRDEFGLPSGRPPVAAPRQFGARPPARAHVVYSLHANNPCAQCEKARRLALAALEEGFGPALKSGGLEFPRRKFRGARQRGVLGRVCQGLHAVGAAGRVPGGAGSSAGSSWMICGGFCPSPPSSKNGCAWKPPRFWRAGPWRAVAAPAPRALVCGMAGRHKRPLGWDWWRR